MNRGGNAETGRVLLRARARYDAVIIWSGWGFLAFLVPMLTVGLMTLLANATGGAGYAGVHHWPAAVGLLLGAAAVYGTAARLDRPGRTLVDPRTGQTVVVRRRHTLFFVPMKYWAILLALGGFIYLVLPTTPLNTTNGATVQQRS